jgi:phosphate transport system permease protein
MQTIDIKQVSRRTSLTSIVGHTLAWGAAFVVFASCLGILGYLFVKGISAVNWEFLTTDPSPSIEEGAGGGVRVPMVGTFLLVILSMLATVPVAIAASVYLAEYMDETKRLTRVIRVGLEVLASVPSVVFGMFGLAVFTLPVFVFLSAGGGENATAAFGRSFIVAAIIMGVHVLPFIVKVCEEAIHSVPLSFRQGAAALGLTKWRAVRKVVLPAAGPGIATGVVLGMGLAAGDTAIVWLTLGGTMTMASDQWWNPQNFMTVLKGTGSTLTTFTYFNSPAGEGNSEGLAFGAALVLIAVVLALNFAAFGIARWQQRAGRAS